MLENVEEFKTWGPLNRRHHPIKHKQGKTFERFVQQLRELGYEVEFRELIAADYGAPTMRKRFFMIARCDGKPIVWPEPTHAPADSEAVKAGLLKPYVGLKIPREERCKVPVIADEQGILQVGKYKSSENYKIDEKTKEVLKVTFKNL